MLLVIDVQPIYPSSEEVLDEVIREVRKAKANKEWIMILEYGMGRTYYRITRELQGYRKKLYARKYRNDGGREVFTAITKYSNNLGSKNVGRIEKIRVCGVNLSACVVATVYSIKMFSQVEVIKRACADPTEWKSRNETLKMLSSWKNVKVV
jgi:hypothetical protein